MAKILHFEDFLSKGELKNLTAWAEREFPAPPSRSKKAMEIKPTFVLICELADRVIESNIGYNDRQVVQRFVDCLNKKFPERHYYFKTEFPKLKEAKVNQ